MRVPEGLTSDHIASAVGPQERVPVLDVASQTSGPRPTLAEWARYFRSRPKERLLNVVSLSLAGTPLQVLHWADRSLASAILSQTTPAILAGMQEADAGVSTSTECLAASPLLQYAVSTSCFAASAASGQLRPMQEKISPPAAVRALDLVNAVWPAGEKPRPEVNSPKSYPSIIPRILRYGVHSLLPHSHSADSCTLPFDVEYQCWLFS